MKRRLLIMDGYKYSTNSQESCIKENMYTNLTRKRSWSKSQINQFQTQKREIIIRVICFMEFSNHNGSVISKYACNSETVEFFLWELRLINIDKNVVTFSVHISKCRYIDLYHHAKLPEIKIETKSLYKKNKILSNRIKVL